MPPKNTPRAADSRDDGYRHCANCKRLFKPANSWHRYCARAECQRVRTKLAVRRIRAKKPNRDRINAQARARYKANPEPKRTQEREKYRERGRFNFE